MTLKTVLRDREFWLSLIALLGMLGNLAVSLANQLTTGRATCLQMVRLGKIRSTR